MSHFFDKWPDLARWPFEHTFWPRDRKITMEELVYGWQDSDGTDHPGLNAVVTMPGVANAWPMPIENRTNMLSTGVKTPVGIKIFGPDLNKIEAIGRQLETVLNPVPGTRAVFAERVTGGYYLDFELKRDEIARYGLAIEDIQMIIESAIGGESITTTVEGRERYPVSVRYARELRDDPEKLKRVLIPTMNGAQVPLGQLANLRLASGPAMIRDEDAQLAGYVFVDMAGRDIGGYVEEAKKKVAEQVQLPPGYTLSWSGEYEYILRAKERLMYVVPLTLLIVFILLYINLQSAAKCAIVLLAVPFSLIGAIWCVYLLGYNMSVAVWVGIIALAGVDAETGVIMLLYLDQAYDKWRNEGRMRTIEDLREAITEGAVKRIRPKMMTVMAILVGLLPIMWSRGAGADVMKRIAAPMIGGVISSFLLELMVYPVIYEVWRGWKLRRVVDGV